MSEKEILENIALMTAQVEWEYPLDYAVTLDTCRNSVIGWKKVIDAIEREIEITRGADYTERRIGLYKALGIIKDMWHETRLQVG